MNSPQTNMTLQLQDLQDQETMIAQGLAIQNTPLLMATEHIKSGGTVTVVGNGSTMGTATTVDELTALIGGI